MTRRVATLISFIDDLLLSNYRHLILTNQMQSCKLVAILVFLKKDIAAYR